MFGFFKRLFQARSAGQSRARDDSAVYLASAPSEPVARMWLDLLRQENITAMVQARGGAVPYGMTVTTEHTLYVLKSQRERAREVLEPYLEEGEER